jgi:hypothetical protein
MEASLDFVLEQGPRFLGSHAASINFFAFRPKVYHMYCDASTDKITATAAANSNGAHKLFAKLWRLSSLCINMGDLLAAIRNHGTQSAHERKESIDLNQERKLKTASSFPGPGPPGPRLRTLLLR